MRIVLGKNKLVVFTVLAVLLYTLVITSIAVDTQPNAEYYFYIYGTHTCPHCRAMESFLTNVYGDEHVFFCEVQGNTACNSKFLELASVGLPAAVPQTFIVYNCTVSALVIGEYRDKTVFDKLLQVNNNTLIPVYVPGYTKLELYGYLKLENGNHLDFINYYLNTSKYCVIEGIITKPLVKFVEREELESVENATAVSPGSTGLVSILVSILPALLVLALLDSVNPCTITMYFTFTVSCISSSRKSWGPPVLFMAIIYIGYLLLALGLLYIASYIPKQVFALLALVIGIYTILSSGKAHTPEFKCTWCEKMGRVSSFLSSKYVLAGFLALFSVVFLLPCTAGPLLLFIAVLRDYPNNIYIPALLLYNAIFILPLILVFTMIYFMGREKRIANWLKKHSDVLEFLVGFLLVLIALVIAFT
ncbi:MAG: hypothetical protein ABWW65_06105 [Thermoprotei archaeon]